VPRGAVASLLKDIIEPVAPESEMSSLDGVDEAKKRPVVFVFHDSSSDIIYLRKLGCNIYSFDGLLEIADTREMWQYMSRSNSASKLETVLSQLRQSWGFLHNAGNDAVYTLRAMIGLAIKRRVDRLGGVGEEPAAV
jgi:hypothetical protein